MSFLTKHQRISRLKEWIIKGRPGNVHELSKSFGVSPRTMKREIAYLREHEKWDISFCRIRQRYQFRGIRQEEN